MQPMRRKQTFWLIVQKNLWAMSLRSFLHYLLLTCIARTSVWVYAAESSTKAEINTNTVIYPLEAEKQKNIDFVLKEIKKCKKPYYTIKSLAYFSDFILPIGQRNLLDAHGILKKISSTKEFRDTSTLIQSLDNNDMLAMNLNKVKIKKYGNASGYFNDQFIDGYIEITCLNEVYKLEFGTVTYFFDGVEGEFLGGKMLSNGIEHDFYIPLSSQFVAKWVEYIGNLYTKEDAVMYYKTHDNLIQMHQIYMDFIKTQDYQR